MKIVVTGGSGQIGRWVVRRLADDGHEVLNLDLVRPPVGAPGRYLHTDVGRRDVAEPRIAEFGAEALCHLGELPDKGRDLEERVYGRNATSTGALLMSAADAGVKRVVYASSVQVYGQFGIGGSQGEFPPLPPLRLPLDESEPPRPWNGYGAQKVGAEQFLASLCRRRGMVGVSLRLPWVAKPGDGRWMRPGRRSHGKVNELGAYLAVQDAASAFAAALALDAPAGSSHVFHLAAEDVRPDATDRPIREALAADWPEFPPLPGDWPERRCPLSIDAFRAATGWRPTLAAADLDDGK